MLAQICLAIALLGQSPEINPEKFTVTANGTTIKYSSHRAARNAYNGLVKTGILPPIKQRRPASFYEDDYARNPSIGTPPRVKFIEQYIVPNMVQNDETSGVSKVHERQIHANVQAMLNRLPPLKEWQPSKVKVKKKKS